MTSRPMIAILLLLALACDRRQPVVVPESVSHDQPQSLPTVAIKLGNAEVTVMIADDDVERQKGLMYRKQMGDNEGMIFCFPVEAPRGFWMKNTPIDLDIVYLDQNAKIVSIHTMRAYSTNSTQSDGDAMFAIELNAGRANELGLIVGNVVDIPAGLRVSGR